MPKFIDQIATGDAIGAKNTMSDMLSAKAFEALDTRKQELAASLFGGSPQEVQEGQLNLEDFSLEELEEFMVSEEFEQLDELSKDTLKSYYKGSVESGMKAQNRAMNTSMGGSDSEHKKNITDINKRVSGQDAVTKRLGSKETMSMDKELGVSRLAKYKPTKPNPKKYS